MRRLHAGVALEPLDDGELAVGAGVHDQAGEQRRAVARDVVGDDDRLGEHLAGRHVDLDGVGVGVAQLVEHVVHGHRRDELGGERRVGRRGPRRR